VERHRDEFPLAELPREELELLRDQINATYGNISE